MSNCKSISTPLEVGKSFHKRTDDEESFDSQVYQQAIGCLTYVSTATRPDISAAVGILSQYMTDPSKEQWMRIKRLLRYIKRTLNYGLKFEADGTNLELFGYSDANWAADVDNRRSTSGYVFKVANSTVSWRSKKQATVAKSTTEAEYVYLSQATQGIIWMRRLLSDIGYSMDQPTLVYEDKLGAIELAKNPKFRNRAKHIDNAFHSIRERIESKEVRVDYCQSSDMLADIMTKALARDQFKKLRALLNVGSR